MIRIAKNCRKPYSQRKQEGLCYHCSSAAIAGRYCLRCWVKNTAFNALGSRTFAPTLLAKWELQKARCFYTGAELKAGANASLCHLHDEAGNVQGFCWVTKDVARMKGGLTDPEFVALCKIIIKYRSGR